MSGSRTPARAPTELPRLWTGEAALRPLGTRRLEVAVGGAHADSDCWAAVVPWLHVLVQVTNGFGLYAQAERVPAYGQGPFGGSAYTNAGVGLTLDFEHLGLMAALHGYFEGSSANAPAPPAAVPVAPAHTVGFAGRLRVNGARQPAVLNPPYVARVSLEAIHDDRAFFQQLVRRLRALAADPGAVAVLFKLEGVDLGYGRVEEVRISIAGLRARGKRTFAYVRSRRRASTTWRPRATRLSFTRRARWASMASRRTSPSTKARWTGWASIWSWCGQAPTRARWSRS